MTNQNFSTTLSVDRTPQEAFDAISNVRGWWSKEIKGIPTNSAMSSRITTKTSTLAK
jgi:hypothetical protein